MKILIIEDNRDILDIVDYILNDKGYEVVQCTDASSIDNLININPDLILMDELLPDTKGSTVCRKLKADENFRHIPVVLVSAANYLSKIAAACGADAYIEKPFDIETLGDMINSLLLKRNN